jgi:hypothetical protein
LTGENAVRFWPLRGNKKSEAATSPYSVSAIFPTARERFAEVYNRNLWGDEESVSGVGSRRDSTSVALTLSALEFVVEKWGIRSLNDIPCGDFNWIEPFLLNRPGLKYAGFDVVPALIDSNVEKYGAVWQFQVLDITKQIPPPADMILTKDLLNHLTIEDIKSSISNIKISSAKYFLCTNNFGKFNEELNDIEVMASRFIDLCAAPFDLPPPIWNSAYMGLWEIAQIPFP